MSVFNIEKLNGLSLYYRDKECKSIEEFLDCCETPTGWDVEVRNLVFKMVIAGWKGKALQVKEKFGGLRFYWSHLEETEEEERKIEELIREAELKIEKICVVCGEPAAGKSHKGWISPFCEIHMP